MKTLFFTFLAATFLSASADAMANQFQKLDPVLSGLIDQASRTTCEQLEKLDPVLANALAEAKATNTDLAKVSVELLASVDGSLDEQSVREIFAAHGLTARSVILGNITVATAEGSLAAAVSATCAQEITVLEGSRVTFPEPSASVGN